MDDPTKDTIPRSAVEYCLRKETVSTNPEKYKTHEKFIDYMNDPDISEFGHWMHSNGFNCALTTISVDLKKIPSVTPSAQPGWIPTSERLPEEDGQYLTTCKSFLAGYDYTDIFIFKSDIYDEYEPHRQEHKPGWLSYSDEIGWFEMSNVTAWMPLPKPYREGGQDGSDRH